MKQWGFLAVVIMATGAVVWGSRSAASITSRPLDAGDAHLEQLDAACVEIWLRGGVEPVGEADELTVLRRLTLGLHGVIPSLAQIREFEADRRPDRLRHWAHALLEDRKFADYFAERFARALVDTLGAETDLYDRSRLVTYLADRFDANAPFDETARQLISASGSPAVRPEVNFVTAAISEDQLNVEMITRRMGRAFLGQRLDCARCHDDPYSSWRQDGFEGLAGYFAQASLEGIVVRDDATRKYTPTPDARPEGETASACLPFEPQWGADSNSDDDASADREQLARWITHGENRRFPRAIVNRLWAIVYGRPLSSPVDNLPDPDVPLVLSPLLDVLEQAFVASGYDVKYVLQVMVASRPFRLASRYDLRDEGEIDKLLRHFAAFPISRLLPCEAFASLRQTASVNTLVGQVDPVGRFLEEAAAREYGREYGDFGCDELEPAPVTTEQALLQMNGQAIRDSLDADTVGLANQLAYLSSSDERCLEACYLVCLARRPDRTEQKHFLPQLQQADSATRVEVIADTLWSLVNSPEFVHNR